MAEENMKLAKAIKDALADDPRMPVDEIAAKVGSDDDTVVDVIDSHLVADDGTITFEGEGAGGGWVPDGAPAA